MHIMMLFRYLDQMLVSNAFRDGDNIAHTGKNRLGANWANGLDCLLCCLLIGVLGRSNCWGHYAPMSLINIGNRQEAL